MDDGATGSTKVEVERFVGHLVEGEYTGSFQQILGLGGFKIKSMVYSGCTDDKAIELLGSAVLGYKWDAKSDIMSVKFKVNLSRKKGKVPEYPDLKIEELEENSNEDLDPGIHMSQYTCCLSSGNFWLQYR